MTGVYMTEIVSRSRSKWRNRIYALSFKPTLRSASVAKAVRITDGLTVRKADRSPVNQSLSVIRIAGVVARNQSSKPVINSESKSREYREQTKKRMSISDRMAWTADSYTDNVRSRSAVRHGAGSAEHPSSADPPTNSGPILARD